MDSWIQLLRHPWPWYVAGALMGLTVPILLWLGNRTLGVSSSLRHLCAAILPGRIEFLRYDWKKVGGWNLLFALGIVIGGYIGGHLLANPEPIRISARTAQDLSALGIHDQSSYLPADLFQLSALLTVRGFVMIVVGGFLIGFGTRYAGGCTSGHGIMGISSLQWPSLVATVAIFAGVILSAYLIVPILLRLPS